MKHILNCTVAALAIATACPAAAQQGDPAALSEGDAIVVTGSRLARSGFDNPTPTTIIGEEQITRAGLNDIGDILLQSPQISVGLGASNDTFSGDIGATFINLRGLGTNRTLVLVDGRRRVSGSRDGSQVDVSTIPAAMIQSVEIITGGASAVYGADAVSGVVNIIMKDDYDGLNLSARAGLSDRGDAESYMASFAGGGEFADGRGSVRLGMTWQKSEMLRYTDRDYAWGKGALSFVVNPANTGPDDGIPDRIVVDAPHTIGSAYEPTFIIGGNRYFWDGGLVPNPNAECYGTVCSGGPYGYNSRERNLRNPRETVAAVAGIDFEIAPAVSAFADFEFSWGSTNPNGQSFFDSSLTLQRDNPTIPTAVTNLMDANGLRRLGIGYEGEEIFGNKQYGNSRYTYTAAAGLEGDLGSRFDWQVFGQYGRRDQDYTISNTRIESRFFEALDAVIDPASGNVVCRSASARANGCAPISIFGGTLSDEQKAYFAATFQRSVTNQQTLAGAQLTGSPLDLPAGPLRVAIGAEYRKDQLSTLDDPLGARGELYRTDNGGPAVSASTEVAEAFGEVLVPVLRDVTLAQQLNVEGALRFSHYDTIGSTLAWKLGGDWEPVEGLRLRVTRSRSVRAPNIVELFSPETLGTLNITADPCDALEVGLNPNRAANCAALGVPAGWRDPASALALTTNLGGNPDLTEETSNSWTAGVVVDPLPGLRLSADYWSIKIEDAIQTLDGNSIVEGCVDSPTLDNAFCPLVTRGNFVGLSDPYVISAIDLRQINIGELRASGIDVSANYRADMDQFVAGWNGRLNIAATVTYLEELEELVDRADPGSLLVEDGESDDPKWRGNLNVTYALDGFSANWQLRYVGGAEIDRQRAAEYYGFVDVDERFYSDVVASYRFTGGTTVQLGVNNLFDENPPRTPNTYSGAFDGSLYDNIGRYVFLGFSHDF